MARDLLRALRLSATAGLALLALVCLAWELWLAPLRPGGSFMALKALPLLLPLRGIAAGRRYTFQWSSILILAYFAEGVTRMWAEEDVSRLLAATETGLSVVFFASVVTYARLTRSANAK